MKQSDFLTLGWRDYARGLIMAVLVPVLTIIQQSLEAGNLVFNWNAILIAAVSGLTAYLLKNFFTQSDNIKAKMDGIIGDRPNDR